MYNLTHQTNFLTPTVKHKDKKQRVNFFIVHLEPEFTLSSRNIYQLTFCFLTQIENLPWIMYNEHVHNL